MSELWALAAVREGGRQPARLIKVSAGSASWNLLTAHPAAAQACARFCQPTPASLSIPSLPLPCTCKKSPRIPEQVNAAPCLRLEIPATDLFTFKLDLCTDFLSGRGKNDLDLSRGAKQEESVHSVGRADLSWQPAHPALIVGRWMDRAATQPAGKGRLCKPRGQHSG